MRHYPNQHQHGYILPLVLILIQIAMLYGVSALMLTQLLLKEVEDKTRFASQQSAAIAVMEDMISTNTLDDLPCRIPLIHVSELKSYSANWWLNNGCRIENESNLYYVVIEALGSDPCGLINKADQGYANIARYYRLSMAELTKTGRVIYLQMQATISVPWRQIYECYDKPHQVLPGLQMHRLL